MSRIPASSSPPGLTRRAWCGVPALLLPGIAQPAADAGPASGTTLNVGPGYPLRTLGQALRRAVAGDTITLQDGTYAGDVGVINQPGLTLRGLGVRATLQAEGRHAEGKAILVVRAPGVRIENLEMRGARVPAGNGAGIRFESGSLTLERCRFFDNEMGLLSAGRPDMHLVVRHCEFGDAPRHDSGLLHHLLYAGAIGSCVVMHCRFSNGWRGHLLKSRASVNRILWNDLVDGPDGEASYELEFPTGGDNLVQGNHIEQSARTQNPAMLSMGAEAGGRYGGRLVLRDNRFVNHHAGTPEAAARFVHLWRERLLGPVDVVAERNVFEGPGLRGVPE